MFQNTKKSIQAEGQIPRYCCLCFGSCTYLYISLKVGWKILEILPWITAQNFHSSSTCRTQVKLLILRQTYWMLACVSTCTRFCHFQSTIIYGQERARCCMGPFMFRLSPCWSQTTVCDLRNKLLHSGKLWDRPNHCSPQFMMASDELFRLVSSSPSLLHLNWRTAPETEAQGCFKSAHEF